MPEQEGLGACFGRLRLGILGGAEEPEVGDDAEVHNMLVEHAALRVLEVEDFEQGSQDGDVDGVSSCLRLVLVPQGQDEINAWGMEVIGSIIFATGIRLVQVGDALAHC